MKISKYRISLTVILALIVSLFTHARVLASSSISISPMSERSVLIPGETYKSSFLVVNPNTSTESLHYKAQVGSYSPLVTEERGVYNGADTGTITAYNDIMRWITIDNPEGVVAPGSDVNLSFSIKVPKDAPAGGQYATIILTNVGNEGERVESGIVVKGYVNIGYIVYAEVAGETRKEGVITENNFPSIMTNRELKATSMVRNNGNIHTDAEYTLQVWPLFSDEEYCTNEEKPGSSLVMPETERYHVQSCDLPTVGIFRAKQTVKIFGEVSELEKMVIVCPVWLIFVILFVIVAFVIWVIVMIKKHKKTTSEE